MKNIFAWVILSSSVIFFSYRPGYSQTAKTKFKGLKSNKPNIIFIMADDMGWGDLGVFYQNQRAKEKGKPFERSPKLDRLAAQGAQLRAHYAAAPICVPSRASILLGLSQGHTNVRNDQLDKAIEDNYTIASVLKKLGYSTASIGKWGAQGNSVWEGTQGANWPGNPLNRGFDYFLGYMRTMDGHEHYPKEAIYSDDSKQVWLNDTNITPELDKTYTADLWTAGAKKWITNHVQSRDTNKPFFMYLAYDTPHAVLELPTQSYPKGNGLHGGLKWIGKPGHMINTASGKVDSWIHPDYAHATYDDDNDPSTTEVPWPAVYKRYATSTRRIDSGVGDIMQLLKDLHIANNTLVVFTSDNGPSRESYLNHNTRKINQDKSFEPNKPTFFKNFGPFDGIKRDTWEGGLREPTIVRWPGHIPAGQIIKSPSISYDWLPTFTAAAGVPGPEESDGVSLLPELTGKGKRQKSLIYVEFYNNSRMPDYKDFAPERRGRKRAQMQMIRVGNYVGVRYNIKSHSDDFEIYNVLKDPGQRNNLAENPEHPPSIKRLQREMKNRVLEVRRPNKTIPPRPYDDVPVPPVKNKKTKQGVNWKLYKGKYPWVPKVHSLTSSKTGEASKPGTNMVDAESNEVVYYTGYLKVPESGKYTFYLKSDTKAEFRIYDITVIDEDYGYWGGVWEQGTIRLKAGLHPFHLYYQRKPKPSAPSLEIQWDIPSKNQRLSGHDLSKHMGNTTPIPAKVFRH